LFLCLAVSNINLLFFKHIARMLICTHKHNTLTQTCTRARKPLTDPIPHADTTCAGVARRVLDMVQGLFQLEAYRAWLGSIVMQRVRVTARMWD